MREMAKKIEEEQLKRNLDSSATTVSFSKPVRRFKTHSDHTVCLSPSQAPLPASTSGVATKASTKVAPVSAVLLDTVSAADAGAAASFSKSSRSGSVKKEGKSSSSSSSRKSSSSSSSKSKSSSSSSHRSSSHHSGSSSSSKDRKRSSKRSSDESAEKNSPSKRSRSSGSESVDGDKKAKHAAVMAKRIPKLAAVVSSAGDTDERMASSAPPPSTSPLKVGGGAAAPIEGPAANQSKTFIDSVLRRAWAGTVTNVNSPWLRNCVALAVPRCCCG